MCSKTYITLHASSQSLHDCIYCTMCSTKYIVFCANNFWLLIAWNQLMLHILRPMQFILISLKCFVLVTFWVNLGPGGKKLLRTTALQHSLLNKTSLLVLKQIIIIFLSQKQCQNCYWLITGSSHDCPQKASENWTAPRALTPPLQAPETLTEAVYSSICQTNQPESLSQDSRQLLVSVSMWCLCHT